MRSAQVELTELKKVVAELILIVENGHRSTVNSVIFCPRSTVDRQEKVSASST